MGFVRSPDCYLDLHQISANTCYTNTKYKCSVRLGWDRQPDMSVRSMVWSGHGVLESESAELDEEWKETVAKSRDGW